MVVFGISQFHSDQVMPILAVITNEDFVVVTGLIEIYSFALFPLAVLYLGLAIRQAELRPRLVELSLICLLFSITPALVGFAFYFCIIHSGRHIRHIWSRVRTIAEPQLIIRQASIFTLASWIVGAAVLLCLDTGNVEESFLRVVFIGLAALTVPHMILVDGFLRRHDWKRSTL
jgi:Brp/Blh family beta-carotene 15,15'-monooxygenase